MLKHKTVILMQLVNQSVKLMHDFHIAFLGNIRIALEKQADSQFTKTIAENVHLWAKCVVVPGKVKKV